MTFLRVYMRGDQTLIEICYFYTIWSYTEELRYYLHPGLCEPFCATSMEPLVTPGSQKEGKVPGSRE